MKLQFICKCGLENYNKEDWIAHWKYGVPKHSNSSSKVYRFISRHPKIRAMYYFLFTQVKVIR